MAVHGESYWDLKTGHISGYQEVGCVSNRSSITQRHSRFGFPPVLFDHLFENDRPIFDKFVKEIYGRYIGTVHKSLVSGLQCKEYLYKVKTQNGCLHPKLVEELCLATGWKTYLQQI
jgi:hypothetical protein